LDDEANQMGFSSYATICVATRFMKHMSTVYEGHPASVELQEKHDLLKHESAFTIERFMACRVTNERKSFYVDVNDEGVFIALHEGPLKGGAGIVKSQYLSDRSPNYHRTWFA